MNCKRYKKDEFIDLENSLALETSVNFSENKINLLEITNTPIGLFKIAFFLLDNKFLFLLLIIFSESLGFITTWALVTKRFWLVILNPIINSIINLFVDDYNIKLQYVITNKWKYIVYMHLNNLSYTSRKKIDMNDFKNQVERTANTLCNIITWAFPTIVRLIVIFTSCLIAFYMQCKMYFIILFSVFFSLYYFFRMVIKQKTLTELRKKKKDIEKIITPLFSWNLHLLQNRNRTVKEILEIESPIKEADMIFHSGWSRISNELHFFSVFISGILLYFVSSSFSNLLINKVIFNQLTNSIANIGYLSNTIANNIKDFDRFIDLIKSSGSITPMNDQHDLHFPLCINSSIILNIDEFKSEKLKINASQLTIDNFDKILLSGESGTGKTQFVNSLQGLIPGTFFNSETNPSQFESKWEYMNQGLRDTIPSEGLTIRRMLNNEPDDLKIINLLKIVLLEKRFNINNLDLPIEGLSGGERMRLAILYTLWNLDKENKQILILDEPEQGLDEGIRVELVQNILASMNKPILVIYHGSKLDLLQLSFTKVWLFKKDEMNVTNVSEKPFNDFKEEIVKEIELLIRK